MYRVQPDRSKIVNGAHALHHEARSGQVAVYQRVHSGKPVYKQYRSSEHSAPPISNKAPEHKPRRSCIYVRVIGSSAENDLNGVLSAAHYRDNIAVNSLAVNSHALNALANVVRVLNGDVVCSAAELTCSLHAVPLVRN